MECQLKKKYMKVKLINLLNQFSVSGRGMSASFLIHPQNTSINNIWKTIIFVGLN